MGEQRGIMVALQFNQGPRDGRDFSIKPQVAAPSVEGRIFAFISCYYKGSFYPFCLWKKPGQHKQSKTNQQTQGEHHYYFPLKSGGF